ncbi:MAG: hypothetical protein MUD17_07270 [Gemmatimonadaceae bacterium]|jgi:hypothetical protein|nr:hypothetical protein [Gemmatimonadaceae bacterium]
MTTVSVPGVSPCFIERAQRGRLVLGTQEPSGDWARRQPPVEPVGGASIMATLLAERDEGR